MKYNYRGSRRSFSFFGLFLTIWLASVLYGAAINDGATSFVEPTGPPQCPSDGPTINPSYGAIGDQPIVAIWNNIAGMRGCLDLLKEPVDLIVAVSGQVRHDSTVATLAKRIGAISRTKGLQYWSSTEQRSRTLITDAYAVSGKDNWSKRPDFTSEEVLSGRVIYFAQNDSRSTGINLNAIVTLRRSNRGLVFAVKNESPIRMGPVVLLDAGALRSIHFVEKSRGSVWKYYSLSLVRRSNFSAKPNSLANRMDAFRRFLFELDEDDHYPLAR